MKPQKTPEERFERRRDAVVSAAEAKSAVYPYVFVTSGGRVHELEADDRAYLEERFDPCDGARPYVKWSFKSKDGWGSIEGFCPRSKLPRGTKVYISRAALDDDSDAEREGHELDSNPEGSYTVWRPRRKTWWRFWER
jgi:hypothetical protein